MSGSVGVHATTLGSSTAARNTTSGRTFVLDLSWYGGTPPTGITGTIGGVADGNTYTQQQADIAGGDTSFKASRWICTAGLNGGNTHVFSMVGCSNPISITLTEVAGVLTSGAIDAAPVGLKDTHSDATPYLSSLTGTTAQADEIVIACTHTYTTGSGLETATWGNGYSPIEHANDPATDTTSTGYKILSSPANEQSSLTSSNSVATDALTFITTFKAAAAGALTPQPPSVFPDKLPPRPSQVERQAFSARGGVSPLPNLFTPGGARSVFPDRVLRPAFPAHLQQAAAAINPRPFPDVPGFGVTFASSLPLRQSTFGHPFTAFVPLVQAAALVPLPQPSYPSAIARPSARTEAQRFAAALPPLPERTSPMALAEYPDAIDRVFMRAASQAFAPIMPPAPERTAPLASAEYPDLFARAVMSPTQQLATSLAPLQAAAAPAVSCSYYPNAIARPAMQAAQQLATALPPLPILPTFADAIYPDTVGRPGVPTAQQLPTALAPLQPVVQTVPPLSGATFPGFVSRPTMPTAEQLPTVLPPLPIIPTGAASAVFPEAVRRPVFAACQQQATALAVAPTLPAPAAPLQPCVVFADSVRRPGMPAHAQQAFTISPLPERTWPYFGALFPDSAPRELTPVAIHQAFTTSPAPERTSVFFGAVFPDAVHRPRFGASEQLAVSVGLVPPAAPIAPQAFAWYPQSVPRPVYPTGAQQAYFAPSFPPQAPPVPPSSYPFAVARPVLAAAEQQAVAWSSYTPPPPVLPDLVTAVYPDSITRPAFQAWQQLAFVNPVLPIVPVVVYKVRYPRAKVRGSSGARVRVLGH